MTPFPTSRESAEHYRWGGPEGAIATAGVSWGRPS